MTWDRFATWFRDRPQHQLRGSLPLTLATIALTPRADPEEVSYYEEAEFEALVEWTIAGRILFSIVYVRRPRILILSTEERRQFSGDIEGLPFISAGLAYSVCEPVLLPCLDPRVLGAMH